MNMKLYPRQKVYIKLMDAKMLLANETTILYPSLEPLMNLKLKRFLNLSTLTGAY